MPLAQEGERVGVQCDEADVVLQRRREVGQERGVVDRAREIGREVCLVGVDAGVANPLIVPPLAHEAEACAYRRSGMRGGGSG